MDQVDQASVERIPVWITWYEFYHGDTSCEVHQSMEEATASIASHARTYLQQDGLEGDPPEDDQEAIAEYFKHVDDSADIQEATLTLKREPSAHEAVMQSKIDEMQKLLDWIYWRWGTFDKQCDYADYTDIDDVWDIVNAMQEKIRDLFVGYSIALPDIPDNPPEGDDDLDGDDLEEEEEDGEESETAE